MVEWGGIPSCWKIICCLWISTVQENPGYVRDKWLTSALVLTENFLWLRVLLNTTLGFSSAHVCSLWILKTPSRVNESSSTQRMLFKTPASSMITRNFLRAGKMTGPFLPIHGASTNVLDRYCRTGMVEWEALRCAAISFVASSALARPQGFEKIGPIKWLSTIAT